MNPTSLNVSLQIYNELCKTCEKFNISKKRLVALIFHYCHKNFNFNNFEYGKLTSYQKKAPDDKWKCLRVDFDDTQCDVYFLYRNKFRISLSKLLAVGFVLFFDKIISDLSYNSTIEKDIIDIFINTYTDIKKALFPFVKISFKYFNISNKTSP